jgi:hypothetical protein
MLALVGLGAAWAADPLPAPNHEVLRPVGVHTQGEAVVPGPPLPCLAKAQVLIPWSICRGLGAGSGRPVRLEARVTANPALPAGTRCALVCDPEARIAAWSFLVPVPGYRGRITCPVSDRLTLTLRADVPHTPPSAGATVQWQTDLQLTEYVVEDSDVLGENFDLSALLTRGRRWIEGPGACPAGQPGRPSP